MAELGPLIPGRQRRFRVVRVEKDMQVTMITIALLTQNNGSVAQ